ncbi:MAG: enoyl-CoA hydratase/isomerase family protein [Proteobacteria bacterium]|nr:enoyl-CoA hydratase/isomerase family protein [Pseudomonadota bacterium]
MSAAGDILFERRGVAGIVTLNRAHALNAITHAMVRALAAQLAAWAADEAVTRVVITAAGERAFCAGGDIRALYDLGRAGRQAQALDFFRDEYTLNAAIKRFPKPYVALIDGLVMGGGFGVSVHGSHRIAGDRFQFAMPEVGIGFFPDVGATWVLPRLPGELGSWCALAGERMRADDAVVSGIATHRVGSGRIADLRQALCGDDTVDVLLAGFAQPPANGELASRRPDIDRMLAGEGVQAILDRLDACGRSHDPGAAWAAATAATIRKKSPTSLKIALRQVRQGRDWSFEECMRQEFRIVARILHGVDFYEGVRAAIIDKDATARWRPPALADVAPAQIDRYFAPLEKELEL